LTDGYSGAEIAAVCNEAALKALEDLMATPMTDEQVNKIRNHK
jgi:SpoVK/Ycf46/Vps4 family AAA+-type ATPase